MDAERLHRVALSLVPGLGLSGARFLLDRYGSAEHVFEADLVMKDPQLSPAVQAALLNPEYWQKAEKEVELCEEKGIRIVCLGDDDYPFRLSECATAPVVLYSIGNVNLNAEKVVSIVGTRHSSAYCRDLTIRMVADLAASFPNLVVVSGLAYGIDITAHQAALDHQLSTVGVLAHGLQEIYPAPHRSIAKNMLKNGGLITESTLGTPSHAYHFLQRNRIVAGLCDACLVMETPVKGGSMNTAATARDFNRDVFAIPGRPADKNLGGCNLLIKRNLAALAESAEDIIHEMNWETPASTRSRQTSLFEALDPHMTTILQLLKSEENTHHEKIAMETGFRIDEVLSLTLQLEMEGLIESLPGGFYRRKMI